MAAAHGHAAQLRDELGLDDEDADGERLNPFDEDYEDAALMLAEERVAEAEAALDLPLRQFLTWCVRIEARYARRAEAIKRHS